MNIGKATSAQLKGTVAYPVTVTAQVQPHALPGIRMTGMPDANVQEARRRVRAAIATATGTDHVPALAIEYSPLDIRKTGTAHDLATAMAWLRATGQAPDDDKPTIWYGELHLDGTVTTPRGYVAASLAARKADMRIVTGPDAPRQISNVEHLVVSTLQQAIRGKLSEASEQEEAKADEATDIYMKNLDLCTLDKLALAAAGGHNTLMLTTDMHAAQMMTTAIQALIPGLDAEGFEQVKAIEDAAQAHGDRRTCSRTPRVITANPHDSIAALVGGGHPIVPGKASLAHNGILYMEHAQDWTETALQALRQPIDEQAVTLTKATETMKMPADVQVVAAAYPCPCGNFGSTTATCRCTEHRIMTYQNRLLGPLKDEIDMQLYCSPCPLMKTAITDDDIYDVRSRVLLARERQRRRNPNAKLNSKLDFAEIRSLCSEDELSMIERLLAGRMPKTTSQIASTMRLAKTIADMNDSKTVDENDIYQAMQISMSL